jgi:hypothetical protein
VKLRRLSKCSWPLRRVLTTLIKLVPRKLL